jgi:ribosomal peptide maturation radical SAM protein 1
MTSIVLVMSPPPSPFVGSMALAQLKAQVTDNGHSCSILYSNMLHARRVGNIVYGCGARQVMMGELPFALALFKGNGGKVDPADIQSICGPYLEELKPYAPERSPEDMVWKLVEHAQATAEETARKILEQRPVVVGFSCTHRQLAASLLIALIVKAECPGTITIFGGNGDLYGPMGMEALRQFRQIDFVARGDSEISFVKWLDLVTQGRAEEPVPGIISRRNINDMRVSMMSDEEFENLPFADHSDFIDQIKTLFPSRPPADLVLPFEMNRGCWWSMTSKRCLFCAENLADSRTRVRSDRRVRAEIEAMLANRASLSLLCTDTAMRKDRYKAFLPWIASRKEIKNLFVETMASLDEEQVSKLAKAKISRFQPGIENLSDDSLRYLSKPTSSRHNIAFLKFCREYGLDPSWNYLTQIPFLQPSELAEQCHRIAVLEHLTPPRTNPLKIQRTSLLFAKLSSMEDMPLEPDPIMKLCFPLDRNSLMNLSLTFVCPSLSRSMRTKEREEHNATLGNYLERWRAEFPTSYLVMARRKNCLVVVDTRKCRDRIRRVLRGPHKDVYEFCSSWKSRAAVKNSFANTHPAPEIDKAVDDLIASNLLLEIDGHILALATRIHLGMRATPPAMHGVASLASQSFGSFIEAGKVLGASWRSIPKRLGCYQMGMLLRLKGKILSRILWCAVRLLLWRRRVQDTSLQKELSFPIDPRVVNPHPPINAEVRPSSNEEV